MLSMVIYKLKHFRNRSVDASHHGTRSRSFHLRSFDAKQWMAFYGVERLDSFWYAPKIIPPNNHNYDI